MKVEVALLGSVPNKRTVSVDVKQHSTKINHLFIHSNSRQKTTTQQLASEQWRRLRSCTPEVKAAIYKTMIRRA